MPPQQANNPRLQPKGRAMESQKKPAEPTPGQQTSGNLEEVLRPFQDASERFWLAQSAAQESATKQRALAFLDLQDQMRKAEQEVYQRVMEATKRRLDKI